MLIAAFPRLVFWPAVDWTVAALDTVRVALVACLPGPLARPLRTDED
jgi:hypothetical protein